MPSDNLEKYIKEKVEAVQHTTPPGINWDLEAAWLKLQQQPVLPRQKRRNWFSYAAAVLVLALIAGLIGQYFVSIEPNAEITATTTPATEILVQENPTEIAAEKAAKHQADNIAPTGKSEELQPKIASDKKTKLTINVPAFSVTSTKKESTSVMVPASEPDAPSAEAVVGSEAIAVSEAATLAETTPQPLKITVVLGKTSTAKMLNQTANNLTTKRRKTRLRLNVPVSEFIDKGHLAGTDSSYQPLKLQARIDL